MTIHYGKRGAGSLTAAVPGDTIYIQFATYNDSGASIVDTGFSHEDVEIYKNNGTVARATDSGVWLGDSGVNYYVGGTRVATNALSDTGLYGDVKGLYSIGIRLFNTTDDTGFYDAGSTYAVTVQGLSIKSGQGHAETNFVPAVFEIEGARREAGAYIHAGAQGYPVSNIGQLDYDTGAANRLRLLSDLLSATGQIQAGTLATDTIAAAKIAADAIGASELATDAVNEIRDAIKALDTGIKQNLSRTDTGIRDAVDNVDTGTTTALTRVLAKLDTGVDANIAQISGDTGSALRLSQMYNGTGYTIVDTAPASRAQVSAIGAFSSAALNFDADDDNVDGPLKGVTFVGVQTSGTFASTSTEDGTVHQIDDTTNAIDIVYQVGVGGGRTGTTVEFKGYLSGLNDTLTVQAYDFDGTSWDQIGTISGQAGTSNITTTYPLLSRHTGTGADIGQVYVRIQNTGQSNPTLYVDQLLVAAVNIGQTIGYALGAVWVDTTASNTNTESFVDGVADNPVSTWAAAQTIASNVGINKFQIASGSSITLDASSDNYQLLGGGWNLALGSQSIDGMVVEGASVTGIGEATTTAPTWNNCTFGAATIPPSEFYSCGFGFASGTFTGATDNGDWVFVNCYSGVPGSGSPTFDFSNVDNTSSINQRAYSGGATYVLNAFCTASHEVLAGGGTTVTLGGADFELRGVSRSVTATFAGTETMQMVGTFGPVTLNSDTGTTTSTVNIYGVTESVTDNRNGAVTLSDRSLSPNTVPNYIWDEADTGHTVSGTMGGRQRDTGAHIDLHRVVAKLDTGAAENVWEYSVSTKAGDTGSTAYAQGRLMAVKGDTGAAHLDAGRLGTSATAVVSGTIDANIVQVNSVSVQGTGDTGTNDPWRPA